MELEVKNIIFETVRGLIFEDQPEKWISISTEIFENLDRLSPSICEDGDVGKIAFGSDDRRMKIRTSRFLTRKLHLNSGFLNDVQIRTVQTRIDEILFGDIVLQTYISTGSDITKNYRDEIGGSSCMTGGDSDCVKLYEDNPDVYSQLIIKRGNDSARAMVVKLDNGRYMLDRIYTDAEDLILKMKNYADDQNWIVGYNRRRSESGIPDSDFIITGLKYINGEVPYQDTLGYGRVRDGLLDLMCSIGDYDFTMDDTNGNIDGGYICEGCEGRVSEEDHYSFNSSIYCECCFDQVAFICDHCGETTSQDDSHFIENKQIYVCEYCAGNHYSFCEECNEYFSTEIVQYVESIEHAVCERCLDRCYLQCTDCHEFSSKDDVEDDLCKDCREIELQKDIGDCIGQLLLPFKDQKCLPLELSLSA